MLHDNTNIIIGPPGTGKTTRLLKIIEEYLDSGIEPDKIGFFTFTKKAASEAKERALKKFPDLKASDLAHFRTIHSFAYQQCNVNKNQVMTKEHFKELSEILGIEITGASNLEDGAYGMSTGDRYFFIENLARLTYRPLSELWAELADEELNWWELDRIARGYRHYKENRLLLDYTDMLQKQLTEGFYPKLDVLVVDEAQDLSPIQWRIIEQIATNTDKAVYIAGDDDQAIYKWAGADVNYFIHLEGNVTELTESYRIPYEVHKVAMDLVNKIDKRRDKKFKSRTEAGQVHWHFDLDNVDMGNGSWLLLARNGYMLRELEQHCERNGYSYASVWKSPLNSPALTAIKLWEHYRKHGEWTDKTIESVERYSSSSFESLKTQKQIWHEALDKIPYREREYFIAALRRGESLVKEPRIRVSTIHGVKGGEADNVLIMTDISYKTFQEMNRDTDNEHRVFYVAATRARQNLHIIMPRTNMSYDF